MQQTLLVSATKEALDVLRWTYTDHHALFGMDPQRAFLAVLPWAPCLQRSHRRPTLPDGMDRSAPFWAALNGPCGGRERPACSRLLRRPPTGLLPQPRGALDVREACERRRGTARYLNWSFKLSSSAPAPLQSVGAILPQSVPPKTRRVRSVKEERSAMLSAEPSVLKNDLLAEQLASPCCHREAQTGPTVSGGHHACVGVLQP